jgi:Tol biopolymer transport system component/tRNA A-37 threonylcarbamoyl transferase component Bud32
MSPDFWRQVERLYNAAVPLDSTARVSLLDDSCAGDLELRREVESLLDADSAAGDFLMHNAVEDHVVSILRHVHLIAPGTTLGQYSVLSHIGSGAIGHVYLALDTKLGRKVALKVLAPGLHRYPERLSRFYREAKTVSALNHPNILTIHDIANCADVHFLAVEFIDGETVRERLAQGNVSVSEALRVVIDAAHALEAAHRSGIVHCDVKPENIMIRRDGLVKVLDFGLARLENPMGPPTEVGSSHVILGTPRYMSPEQAQGDRLDPRTDIFSLGAVLYEMLAGKPAFPGASTAETFASVVNRKPDPFSGPVPKPLAAVVSRALEKDRAKRFQTMEDFARDLDRAHARIAARPARNRYVRVALPVLAILAAIAVALFGTRLMQIRAAPPRLTPLITMGGGKDHAALSPDGKRVAFAWNGGRAPARDIYVLTIGEENPVRLTNAPEDDWFPTWSPDGRFIAFDRHVKTGQQVFIVPADGGSERRIVDAAGVGVSWSPDGKSLAIAEPGVGRGIALVSLETGRHNVLTDPGPHSDALPVFSPNGRYVAFTRSLTLSAREVFVVDAAGGPARRRTFDQRPTLGMTWTPDSRYVIFASNRAGRPTTLWKVAVRDGEPELVLNTIEDAQYPNMSGSNGRLVFTRNVRDTNIYLFQGRGFANPKGPGPYEEQDVIAESSREDHSESFSPDGRRIVFVSKRTGNEEIWVADIASRQAKQLTSMGLGTGSPHWSPDGKRIVFDSRSAGSPDIYVVSVDGGAPQRITSDPTAETRP